MVKILFQDMASICFLKRSAITFIERPTVNTMVQPDKNTTFKKRYMFFTVYIFFFIGIDMVIMFKYKK